MTPEAVPDFVIIGAPRAGTTSLYHILDRIPAVCMSSIKEPRFFEREVGEAAFATRRVSDPEEYGRLWDGCGEGQIRGEASPVYLFDPGTPVIMAEQIPDARLIVSVRNPVERAISHYFFREQRTGRSTKTLRECIEASLAAPISDYERSYLIEPGMYARNLVRWLEHFPREQIHVVVFEELIADPTTVVSELCEFLGTEPPTDLDLSFRESNAAARPRSRLAGRIVHSSSLRFLVQLLRIDQMARRWGERILTRPAPGLSSSVPGEDVVLLADTYREDVDRLKALLGKELPWDLVSSAGRG